MGKDHKDSCQKCMKSCFVLLERLDENLLNRYSEKYDLKVTSTLSRYKSITNLSARCPKSEKIRKNLNKNKKRNGRNAEKPVAINKFKKKKSKVKPLCYSDDEDYPTDKKEKSLTEKTNAIQDTNASDSSNAGANTKFVNKTFESGNSTESKKKSDGFNNASLDSLEQKQTGTNVEENHKVISKNILESLCFSESCQVLTSAVNCESSSRNKMVSNNESFECNRTQNEGFIEFELSSKENKEVDCESREDSEDDRITVIFEEKLHSDEDQKEIIDWEESERVKTVKKRDIKTRKKQTLIKFRKKKLGRVKNPKNGILEKSSGKETFRRTTSADRVSEDCFKEVCCLVKRLHELYRIISQLQKELPKNGELAVHFSKVISIQQENFRREIRKSQKTILQVYEKMLVCYREPKKVTSEISRQTSLTVDDVIKIISCCLLLEGASEVEKNKNEAVEGTEKFEAVESNKLKIINESSLRPTTRKTTQDAASMEPQHPCLPSWSGSVHLEPVPRSTSQYIEACQPSTGVQSYIFKNFLGPFGNNPKQYDEKSCTRQRCAEKTQMAFDPKPASTANDLKQRYSHFVSRPLQQHRNCLPSNVRIQSRPVMLMPESVGAKLYEYPVNSIYFPQEGSLPSSGGEVISVPYLINHPQEKSSVNYLCQRNKRTQNPSVSIPLPAVNNTVECVSASKYSAVPFCSTLPVYAYPSKTFCGVPRGQILTSGKNQGHMEGIITDSVIFPNQKLSRQRGLPHEKILLSIDETTRKNYCSGVNSKLDLGNSSSEASQNVLDPTVPQKLTMKNYRLQAGPVLDLDSDNKMTETNDKINPSTKEDSNTEKLKNPKIDVKSRVYDCAQNGCKNRGVRICKGCQSIIYCSDTCQLKDWTLKHKEECHQLKKLRGQ